MGKTGGGDGAAPKLTGSTEPVKEDGSTELSTRLAFKLDTLDALPEPARAFYRPVESGGYQLDAVLPDPLATAKDELRAARAEAARLRVEAREERARLKEGFSSDSLDEVRALVAAARSGVAEARKLADEHAAGIAAKEAELSQRHAEALAPIQATAEKFNRQRDRVMISRSAATAVAEASGSVRLIAPLVEKRCRVEDADGTPKVIVLDEAGVPSALTVPELVAEMRKDRALAQAFEPEVRPKANGAANGHAADASTMSASEILGAIRRGELPIKR